MSVICGSTQVDVGLPSNVPIADLIPELARLLLRDQYGESEPVPDDLSTQWSLERIGEGPLNDALSLSEAGVFDGGLLVLRTRPTRELPALYDDVVDAIAGINHRSFRTWTPGAGAWIGIIGGVAGSVVAVGAGVLTHDWGPGRIAAAVVSAILAIVSMAAASLSVSRYSSPNVSAALTTLACALGFATGWAAIPPGYGGLSVVLGLALSTAIALISLRITVGNPLVHMALIAASLVALIGAVGFVTWTNSLAQTGALVAALGLWVTLIAPRATVALAKLPIPTVPSPGTPLDSLDAEEHGNVRPGVSAIGHLTLPTVQALEVRAKAANSYVSGLMLGSAVAAVVGAVMVAMPGEEGTSWPQLILAYVVVGAIAMRGRSHVDLVQAATLFAVGLTGLLGVSVAVMFASGGWALAGYLMCLATVAGAIYFGAIAPRIEFSPTARRAGELLEYAMIVLVVPFAAWVIGLYGLARNA
ncbi:MAG: type VII secretion integral membrane protein EccD [Nocardiaceae bacterium]|nr:type VII secretion integral membrane protein EccD [Nocardiaceae bacterium]